MLVAVRSAVEQALHLPGTLECDRPRLRIYSVQKKNQQQSANAAQRT